MQEPEARIAPKTPNRNHLLTSSIPVTSSYSFHEVTHINATWMSALAFDPYRTCKVKCKATRSRPYLSPLTSPEEKDLFQAYFYDPFCSIQKLMKLDWKAQVPIIIYTYILYTYL
jgi:hypothetical protein